MKRILLICLMLFATVSSALHAEDPVRVMSYNIRYLNNNDGDDHWRFRVDSVSETVSKADVVGLQEATKPQIDQIAQNISGYDWYGVGRDDGADRGEYTPIFWRKDRFELIDKGTLWLGTDPQAVGQPAWGANLPRICSWVVLQDRTSEKLLLFLNTHFDHQSRLARLNSALLIRTQAAKVAGNFAELATTILTGDFNCEVGSNPINELQSENGKGMKFVDTRDLSEQASEGPTGTWNGFKEIAEGRRIDFIFMGEPKMTVKQHRTLDPKTDKGRFASDHLPVVIELE